MKKQITSLSAVLLILFESHGLVAIDKAQWNSEISAGHPVLINTVSSYDSYGTLISRKMQVNTSPVSKSISSIESSLSYFQGNPIDSVNPSPKSNKVPSIDSFIHLNAFFRRSERQINSTPAQNEEDSQSLKRAQIFFFNEQISEAPAKKVEVHSDFFAKPNDRNQKEKAEELLIAQNPFSQGFGLLPQKTPRSVSTSLTNPNKRIKHTDTARSLRNPNKHRLANIIKQLPVQSFFNLQTNSTGQQSEKKILQKISAFFSYFNVKSAPIFGDFTEEEDSAVSETSLPESKTIFSNGGSEIFPKNDYKHTENPNYTLYGTRIFPAPFTPNPEIDFFFDFDEERKSFDFSIFDRSDDEDAFLELKYDDAPVASEQEEKEAHKADLKQETNNIIFYKKKISSAADTISEKSIGSEDHKAKDKAEPKESRSTPSSEIRKYSGNNWFVILRHQNKNKPDHGKNDQQDETAATEDSRNINCASFERDLTEVHTDHDEENSQHPKNMKKKKKIHHKTLNNKELGIMQDLDLDSIIGTPEKPKKGLIPIGFLPSKCSPYFPDEDENTQQSLNNSKTAESYKDKESISEDSVSVTAEHEIEFQNLLIAPTEGEHNMIISLIPYASKTEETLQAKENTEEEKEDENARIENVLDFSLARIPDIADNNFYGIQQEEKDYLTIITEISEKMLADKLRQESSVTIESHKEESQATTSSEENDELLFPYHSGGNGNISSDVPQSAYAHTSPVSSFRNMFLGSSAHISSSISPAPIIRLADDNNEEESSDEEMSADDQH